MIPPRALGHAFELFHKNLKKPSIQPRTTAELDQLCITFPVFKSSFVFWQMVHRMLAWSSQADNSAIRQDARDSIESEQTIKLYAGRKYAQHTLNPVYYGKIPNLRIHLTVHGIYFLACT